jgi:cytochrome b involved in lipid metabolism
MKKTLTAFALALVLSVVVAPGSSASVKAGAACKKAGLVNITGGLKYACESKSGKLTWSKGVACKAGLTNITSGFRYSCVKKSGKLVWVKGAAVKPSAKPRVTAKPSASATAAPASSTAPSVRPSATAAPSVAPSVAPASYTMAQVSANKTAAKCWSVISGNVYDLTTWINAHPGGAGAIISLCGSDGTQDFLAMHRNQSKPESRLSAFLLGPLAK